MNRLSGAEALVRLLQGHGVTHIFGLCGDTSLPLYDALLRLDHGITHLLSRDERSAAYMADAYARLTGRVGVCEGPSGGGATYILPGVVEANESSIALLAITTDIAVGSRGRYVLTELDQEALFRPLTKWNAVIDRPERLPGLVRMAFRQMTTGRPGAVHLGLPFDVQNGPVDAAELRVDADLGRFPARPVAPDPAAIEGAAAAIRTARHPLMVCGGGPHIAGALGELRALAEAAGIAVATTISGKGALADDHPLALGVVGSNGGTPETRAVLDAADLVIFVGCRAGSVTTERWRHPAPGAARIVHIDVDPAVIGASYATEVAVVGDARLALAALREALGGERRACALASAIAEAKAAKLAGFAELAASDAAPIRPERIVAELQAALPADSVICADPGTPCPYLAAYWRQDRAGRQVISNRAHGALGWALPASIGAQIARPAARIVALMGDGSFGFACGELETVARLGLPIVFVVVANATFGWIKAGQKSGFGGRYFGVDFGASDHAAIARAFGIEAERVEDPRALGPALRRAVAAERPVLLDVVAQPLHEARAPVSEWVA